MDRKQLLPICLCIFCCCIVFVSFLCARAVHFRQFVRIHLTALLFSNFQKCSAHMCQSVSQSVGRSVGRSVPLCAQIDCDRPSLLSMSDRSPKKLSKCNRTSTSASAHTFGSFMDVCRHRHCRRLWWTGASICVAVIFQIINCLNYCTVFRVERSRSANSMEIGFESCHNEKSPFLFTASTLSSPPPSSCLVASHLSRSILPTFSSASPMYFLRSRHTIGVPSSLRTHNTHTQFATAQCWLSRQPKHASHTYTHTRCAIVTAEARSHAQTIKIVAVNINSIFSASPRHYTNSNLSHNKIKFKIQIYCLLTWFPRRVAPHRAPPKHLLDAT